MTDPIPFHLLVTGAGGQLGADLLSSAERDPHVVSVAGLTRSQLDISDAADVRRAITDHLPSGERLVVVNAAAWTDVDGAEANETPAYAVNATGPAALAAACAAAGATLIQVSTDYVFDGSAKEPYEPTDPTHPVSAYGRTKEAGERAVRELHPNGSYVVRTAWVYGATGSNFVKTIARLEAEREQLTVVDDQIGSPTWAHDLAGGLLELAAVTPAPGIYHLTGGGETTWWGFARSIFELLGADPERVKPCSTSDFPRPAPRPAYSVLSNAAWVEAGLKPLPHWEKSIMKAFDLKGFPRQTS